ncbi:MAG: flagellar basal body rod protein FlgB [Deferribacteres bacterium]|nr:flagellar basal body rod protein FlgB [candidate division KSB1 bacterium]MCB9501917.1 flagellar basal body rod protein FlgB [Deferribacteres bacterium]
MLLDGIFNHTKIPLLSKSLKAAAVRQRVRANNIANANTPGYQRLEVSFEEELRRVLDNQNIAGVQTHEKHFPLGRREALDIDPEVYVPNDPADPSGVNNVDIEYEMAELAKNQLIYTAASKFAARNFQKIKAAIKGRT